MARTDVRHRTGLGVGVRELGVAAVYTPKDYGLTEIMGGIVDVIRRANGLD